MINGRENNPAPRFQGLAIHVIAAIEELKLTKELARFIRKSPFPKGLDWVLAYMAIGQMGRALIWYKHLCIKGVFLCPWLDLLPCFAPLARHPRFNEVRQHFRPEYHPKRRSD
jgi:hypothetical protein